MASSHLKALDLAAFQLSSQSVADVAASGRQMLVSTSMRMLAAGCSASGCATDADTGYVMRKICAANCVLECHLMSIDILRAVAVSAAGGCSPDYTVKPGDTVPGIIVACCLDPFQGAREICGSDLVGCQKLVAGSTLKLPSVCTDPDLALGNPGPGPASPVEVEPPTGYLQTEVNTSAAAAPTAPEPMANAQDVGTAYGQRLEQQQAEEQRWLRCNCNINSRIVGVDRAARRDTALFQLLPDSVTPMYRSNTSGNTSEELTISYTYQASQSSEFTFGNAFTEKVGMSLGADMKIFTAVGITAGLSGELSFSKDQSTKCSSAQSSTMTVTRTFKWPSGRCGGVYGYARQATPTRFTARTRFTAVRRPNRIGKDPSKAELLQCPIIKVLVAFGMDVGAASNNAIADNSIELSLDGVASSTGIVSMDMQEYICAEEDIIVDTIQRQGTTIGACAGCLQKLAGNQPQELDAVSAPDGKAGDLTKPLPQQCAAQNDPGRTDASLAHCTSRAASAYNHTTLHMLAVALGVVYSVLVSATL